MNVGNLFECPEGHKARIVWISEDRKVVAVRCPEKHLSKIATVADYKKPARLYGHHATKEEKVYARNLVFLIKIQ